MATPITGEKWGDVVHPVRDFLLAKSEQEFDAIRPRLDASHKAFVAAAEDLSEAQAAFRPSSGEGEDAWGIAEVLRHIASIEPIMADRIRLLGNGESVESLTPTYAGYMEAVDTRSLSELLPALAASYASLLAAIDEIDGHERLDTVAPHRLFGDLNCRSFVVMHALHLEDHTRQMQAIRALPDFPAA
jgi:hypothetical protein